MNRTRLMQCLLATGFVISASLNVPAQQISTSEVLHRTNRCDHVIALIHRHGVNNSVNRAVGNAMIHHAAFGGIVVDESDVGDLQLAGVNQIVDQDSTCGPKFAVLIRNQSNRVVSNFRLSAVGTLGRISPFSPSTTITVGAIGAGESLQVEITLPLEALAMGNRNGQIIGLQRLVIAIDSFDELAETNEANNLHAFNLAQIPTLTLPVETTSVSTTEVQVDAPTTQAPATEPTTQTDRLRSAIEKLAVEQTGGAVN